MLASIKKKWLIKNVFRMFGVDITRKAPHPLEFLNSYNIRTIIDVGAHDGGFASEVRTVSPNVMIHAFEPLHGPFQRLQKNFQYDPAFKAWNVAMGEESGSQVMSVNTLAQASSFLPPSDLKAYYEHADVRNTQQVQMVTFDEWATDVTLEPEILLKADVQGYEGHVLRGATHHLSRIRILILEVFFVAMYQKQPLFHDLYSLVTKHGFTFHGMYEPGFDWRTGRQLWANAIFCKK